MIDVLFAGELFWCIVWLGRRPPLRALICTAGILASVYAASQCATWLTNFLTPPSSGVFLWIENQVNDSAQSVAYLGAFLPPQSTAAMTSAGFHQWIAYSILKASILLLTTLAIYWLFLVTLRLMDALWDNPTGTRHPMTYQSVSLICGICAGLTTALLSAYGFVHIAWLKPLIGLSAMGVHSLSIHGLEAGVAWLRLHGVELSH